MIPLCDTVPNRRPPVATWLLILLNCMVFVAELGCPEPLRERVLFYLGIVPARYTQPGWDPSAWAGIPAALPFLAHMFLHAGWLHIIGNMWTLWIFGDNVEDRMGSVRFLVFYLLCGLAAGLTHLLTNVHSTVPTVGASGAISGVLAAYLLLYPLSRIIVMMPLLFWPFFFEMPAFFYMALWFLIQLFSGTLSLVAPGAAGGVAWWAHIGGFVAGLVLCPAFVVRRKRRRRLYRDELGLEGAWLRT